ncbi:MAG: NfeD family protein [Planctomycetota bacterium]
MSLALPIFLIALGIVFVFAEVFFVSFGILAVCAAASFIGACVSAFAISTQVGVYFLVAVALLSPAAVLLAFHLFPRSPLGRHFVARGLSFDSQKNYEERDLAILGHAGIAEGPLRPAGIARIGGRRVDVVTRGELIDLGEPIQVLEISGNRVVVGRAAAVSAQTAPSQPERS